MNADEFAEMVLALPGVERGLSYGEPSFKLGGKFFCRLRDEDDVAIVKADLFTRDALIAADPGTFFVTPHYESGPYVLARLDQLEAAILQGLLRDAWQHSAPPKLLREHAAGFGGRPA